MKKTRIIAAGDYFGSDTNDEFRINVEGNDWGVFKKFEYLTIPFSFLGREDISKRLLDRAKTNGTSFNDELEKDTKARDISTEFLDRMRESSDFSRQVFETLLSRVYVRDNQLFESTLSEMSLEQAVARSVRAWETQADFYCIEGLVGGDGISNPLMDNPGTRLPIAGIIDCLEGDLPVVLGSMGEYDRNKFLIQMSRIVERDYNAIEYGSEFLSGLFTGSELDDEDLGNMARSVDALSKTSLEGNLNVGIFTNSLIRFHNWLPISLKSGDCSVESYEGLTGPIARAIELVDEATRIELGQINDATSPKGVALARLIDEGKIPGKEVVIDLLNNQPGLQDDGKHSTFEYEDPAFYTGLVGGKWKGLKLLHDTKNLFGLTYKLAPGFCISSIAVNQMLEGEGVLGKILRNSYAMDEQTRAEIVNDIGSINVDKYLKPVIRKVKDLGERVVIRSSMYGEDGKKSFAGTYESFHCEQEDVEEGIKGVMESYFSHDSVASREQSHLAHVPGISIVAQERLEGIGGALYITSKGAHLTYGSDAEEAMNGNGIDISASNVRELLQSTSVMSNYVHDFEVLHDVFGDIDVEFVVHKDELYLIQLRSKFVPQKYEEQEAKSYARVSVDKIDDLVNTKLDSPTIVSMPFLKGNIMGERGKIMDFLRSNRDYVMGVEGYVSPVSHIPNNIEGMFFIPYELIKE